MMAQNIADLRKEYTKQYLNKDDLHQDPFKQFSTWFEEILSAKGTEPNAMTLSTVSREGKPSSRVVLLKGIRSQDLVFYTNYNSRKGDDMKQNPNVALNFFWPELERQVRIEGVVEKIDEAASEDYFHSRPKGSQIGAWASPQSEVIENREVLETRLKYYEEEFKGQEVPKPKHWGGYRVIPERFEFWQGRASRLHDRYLYRLEEGVWTVERLAP